MGGNPLLPGSWSIIPITMILRRNGASKAKTVSILHAIPETGVDSVAIA
ncbi:MAG: hypothetical protein HQL84_08280 [Magnetococcales bacterium]|nr:hypothetical protein [Magnetococcales bacterium]MBF0150026.1 hypothetical protein [Magnetococcales bacterium]MBF0173516.1 hypothetical protein [Magnetococcales bacterium]